VSCRVDASRFRPFSQQFFTTPIDPPELTLTIRDPLGNVINDGFCFDIRFRLRAIQGRQPMVDLHQPLQLRNAVPYRLDLSQLPRRPPNRFTPATDVTVDFPDLTDACRMTLEAAPQNSQLVSQTVTPSDQLLHVLHHSSDLSRMTAGCKIA
jgi:hypothetical protein